VVNAGLTKRMVWSVFTADILNINLSQSVLRKKQNKAETGDQTIAVDLTNINHLK
jgi:hypothetical protein